jgi:hypothetical protein
LTLEGFQSPVGDWSSGPNSFAEDAPNDALIVEDTKTGNLETAVIESFNPIYDINMLIHTINPGWQHRGVPPDNPTTWELNYFNLGPDPITLEAYAECAKLVDVP